MRNRFLSVLLVVVVSGCAGKAGPDLPKGPVNGECGPVKDMCLLGTPSGTGGINSPYGWMCLGLNGGSGTPCSTPLSPRQGNEVFAGQDDLVAKAKEAGSLRGKLAIIDPTVGTDNSGHANLMRRVALSMEIPSENISLIPGHDGSDFYHFFRSDEQEEIHQKTRVAAVPSTLARNFGSDIPNLIARHNILFVIAVGNTERLDSQEFWDPDHPFWGDNPGRYENAFRAFETGKVILARCLRQTRRHFLLPFPALGNAGRNRRGAEHLRRRRGRFRD